jgi:hypothetical protein
MVVNGGEIVISALVRGWRLTKRPLSALGRPEIYLRFVLTKNQSRLRHRTWRQ